MNFEYKFKTKLRILPKFIKQEMLCHKFNLVCVFGWGWGGGCK